MGTDIDRQGIELAALLAAADFRAARVLEIGCGDGRLARRYADMPRLAVGIDPDAERLASAAAAARSVRFVRAPSVPLPFRHEAFDIVLFGWSL